jgi:hypothetical protein
VWGGAMESVNKQIDDGKITFFNILEENNLSFDKVKDAYDNPLMREMLMVTFQTQIEGLDSEDFVGLDLAQEDVPDAIYNYPKVIFEPSFDVDRGVIASAFNEVGEVRLPFPKMTIITCPPIEGFNGKVVALVPIYVTQDHNSILAYFVTNRKGKVDVLAFRFYMQEVIIDGERNKMLTEIIATPEQVKRLGGQDKVEYFAHFYMHVITRVVYIMTISGGEVYMCKPSLKDGTMNAKRMRKGKKPLLEFRMITIDGRKPDLPSTPHGTHASPRLHWRRGHWRNTKTGKKVWIDPMLVGDEKNGKIVKDYAIGKYEEQKHVHH